MYPFIIREEGYWGSDSVMEGAHKGLIHQIHMKVYGINILRLVFVMVALLFS